MVITYAGRYMKPKRNIVWISLESVGAKHTSLNGSVDTTPNLVDLAKTYDGTIFDRCFSASMWTPASTASILTGTHMATHDVGIRGRGQRSVPADLATLPELLREKGYSTMCASPNPYITSAAGMDRGFDDFYHFSKYSVWKEASVRSLFGYLRMIRSYGPGFSLNPRKHNLSWFLGERVKQWFKETPDPKFIYSHIGNPHHPYCPPLDFRYKFVDRAEAYDAIKDVFSVFGSSEQMKKTMANGEISNEILASLKAMYYGEIAYADEIISNMIEEILFQSPETLIVVTADHGEAFGEQGVLGHNLILDDALTHVPAVVFGFDSFRDTSKHIGHVDLVKTLSSVIGTDAPQFEGTDLIEELPDYCISQRGRAHLEGYLDHNSRFDVSKYHASPLTAVRTEQHKLLYSKDKTELFRLPDEETDESKRDPELVDELQTVAKSHHFDDDIRAAQEAEFGEGLTRQLEELGYL